MPAIRRSPSIRGARRRRWCRCRTGCCASRSRPSRPAMQLDRHRAGRRQQQPRGRRLALAECRRLKLVARGMAVEFEALRLRRLLQPVEMRVEVEQSLLRDRSASLLRGRAALVIVHRPTRRARRRAAQAPRDCAHADAPPRPCAMIQISRSPRFWPLRLRSAPRQPSRSTREPRRGSTGSSSARR